MEADLLKQLENCLISYQENQETLDVVVQCAQRTLGDDWIKLLPQAFDAADMDDQMKSLLRDKANHVIHYYSALLAWQEAYSYLNDPSSIMAESLSERIPVLEYWLSLFGNEGAELTQKVKDLYVKKAAIEAEVQQNILKDEKKTAEQSSQEDETAPAEETKEPVEEKAEEEVIEPEESVPTIEEVKKEIIEEPAINENIAEEIPVEDETIESSVVAEEPVEGVIIEEKPTEESIIEEKQEEILTEKEPTEENILEEKPVEEEIIEEVHKEEPVEETPVVVETSEEVIEEEPETIVEIKKETPEETVVEETPVQEENVVQEEVVEEIPVLREITKESNEPSTQKEMTEETDASDNDTNIDNVLNDWIDLDSIPTAEPPVSPIREPKGPENDPQFVSQNWDITAYLKQKELFDAANNWLSAWCVRMDNAEKTSYPYYGFIVDLMHDLKEKAQLVLENQLLEDSVEQDVPEGRVGMERVVEAIDKEFETLPDDFKTSTAEKIKLNAREILGRIDTSTEREEIEKAPDGFELIDDPYETSTQQIIDDFEKTEKEAQNKIDNLNVMEDSEK